MSKDDRQELDAKWKEFARLPFPKLGYKVEGLPEVDSVLAGLALGALRPGRQVSVPESRIVSQSILSDVRKLCDEHEGSCEAAELKSYVEKMHQLEDLLRRLTLED